MKICSTINNLGNRSVTRVEHQVFMKTFTLSKLCENKAPENGYSLDTPYTKATLQMDLYN
jgi:hypothetical protein